MEITHEQAHTLIQRNTDRVLSSQESSMLSAHLRACTDCQAFANEIEEVDRLLAPLLKRQWNHRPIPLSVASLRARNQKIRSNYLLATRRAALGLVVFALFFSAWQFVIAGPTASNPLPLLAPPVPTPSAQRAQSTDTMIAGEDCQTVPYIVQGDDTLAGIATNFSVSKQEIMEINRLKTEVVTTSMKLVIPVCRSTPTGTMDPATFTTTNTPLIHPQTSTPGG